MNLRYTLLLLAVVVGVGCSSDPDTPLGTEFIDGGLIDSDPGQVSNLVIPITGGDMSFLTNRALTRSNSMFVGRNNGREKAIMVRFDFSKAGSDTLRTVTSAELVLRRNTAAVADTVLAQFFEFNTPFDDADTLTALDLDASPIPDESGDTDRLMTNLSIYELPNQLVQDWIRGDRTHNGIAIVMNEPATDKEIDYGTRKGSSDLRPRLEVVFDGQDIRNFTASDDGTFVTDLAGSPWLRLSDGETRRIFVPVDVSAIEEDNFLYDARLVFKVVEGSATNIISLQNQTVEMYAPEGSAPEDLFSGNFVVGRFVPVQGDTVTQFIVPIGGIVRSFIEDPARNHGLVLRFTNEATSIRWIDFFGSADPDTLKPFIDVTFSEPPSFPTESP